MTEFTKIIKALKCWLDEELLQKMSGINKWIVGAGLSMTVDKAPLLFEQLKQNPMITALGVIDPTTDRVDVDRLYKYMRAEADKSAATLNFPLLGNVTVKADDLDAIYKKIKEM